MQVLSIQNIYVAISPMAHAFVHAFKLLTVFENDNPFNLQSMRCSLIQEAMYPLDLRIIFTSSPIIKL